MFTVKSKKAKKPTIHLVEHIVGDNIYRTLCGKTATYSSSSEKPTCVKCVLAHNELTKIKGYVAIDALVHIIKAQRPPRLQACERTEDGAEMFPFIPMQTTRIIEDFILLKNILSKEKRWSGYNCRYKTKFLDAGCGIGNILLIAKSVGLAHIFTGIEYNKENIKRANRFLGIPNSNIYDNFKIIHEDILKFNKYDEYDIIYYYCPLQNHSAQMRFESIVEDAMKVGAVVVPYLKRDGSIAKDKRFEIISNCSNGSSDGIAYIKVKDDKRIKLNDKKDTVKSIN